MNLSKHKIKAELILVFALSLGASAIYSVVSLIAKITAKNGLAGQSTTINQSLAERAWLDLTYQLLGIVFGLTPVALALYLLWQSNKNPFKTIGLTFQNPINWLLRGLGLAAAIGIPGIALYLAGRYLGLAAKIVPSELPSYWWTIPVLLLAAIKAALVEEVLVVGYLFNRLELLGLSNRQIITISALFRGSYHLYQGITGFLGNAIMGAIFGLLYKRWGKVTPLVFAHFLLDAVSFVGYTFIASQFPL